MQDLDLESQAKFSRTIVWSDVKTAVPVLRSNAIVIVTVMDHANDVKFSNADGTYGRDRMQRTHEIIEIIRVWLLLDDGTSVSPGIESYLFLANVKVPVFLKVA